MNNSILHILFRVRKGLSLSKHDRTEITGQLVVSVEMLEDLRSLSQHNIVEDHLIRDGASVPLHKITLSETETFSTTIVLYTHNLPGGSRYFERLHDFLDLNQHQSPNYEYCIFKPQYFSTDSHHPKEISQYHDLVALIGLLTKLADYVNENIGEAKELIFFQKKKLTIPIVYSQNNLRKIPYLNELSDQLNTAHDKEERKSILKNEIVLNLYETAETERFAKLLSLFDYIYDNYLKSHLLYLEKFSYHDLKSEVDKDKLEYTKRIYGTVNEIQTKLIAVPAAFLLVLSQFDFAGQFVYKNILIVIGAVLFSVLLEILLSNQFGVLSYIKKEIDHFKHQLSNRDTQVDLREFINSFADLDTIRKKQYRYLWVFRVVIWLVPIVSFAMLLIFSSN